MSDVWTTPDQRFMFMLMKRIEVLEDEISHVKTRFDQHEGQSNIHNATRYHYMKVCLIGHDIIGKEEMNNILNILFRNRVAFLPCFASWKITNNTLEIAFAVQDSLSVVVFRKYVEHNDMNIKQHIGLDYASFEKMFLNKMLINDVDNEIDPPIFHYLYQENLETMLEYWYSRADGVCTDADLDWNTDNSLFTVSKNYKGSNSVLNQKYLTEEIYINSMLDKL
jgi:hypothetical protein